jgi:ATP-dependent 26S proteasome regulatory subunit
MKLYLRTFLFSFLFNALAVDILSSNAPITHTKKNKKIDDGVYTMRLILFLSILSMLPQWYLIMKQFMTNEKAIKCSKISDDMEHFIFSQKQKKYIKLLELYRDDIKDYSSQKPMNKEKINELVNEMPKGFLLYGNPGNGKSEFAKALAHTFDAYYVQITPEHIDAKFVGDAEKNIGQIFSGVQKKSLCGPIVVFVDEFENIGKNRQNIFNDTGKNHVPLLLQKFVDIRAYPNIILVVATNLKENLDKALMRPGRFDVKLLFDDPNQEQRKAYISNLLSKNNVNEDLINFLTEKTQNGSYADILGCIKAARWELRLENRTEFKQEDFSFEEIGKSKMINYHQNLVV